MIFHRTQGLKTQGFKNYSLSKSAYILRYGYLWEQFSTKSEFSLFYLFGYWAVQSGSVRMSFYSIQFKYIENSTFETLSDLQIVV